MGLFSKFKATFKAGEGKSKKSRDNIVCVKYTIFSEFESPAPLIINNRTSEPNPEPSKREIKPPINYATKPQVRPRSKEFINIDVNKEQAWSAPPEETSLEVETPHLPAPPVTKSILKSKSAYVTEEISDNEEILSTFEFVNKPENNLTIYEITKNEDIYIDGPPQKDDNSNAAKSTLIFMTENHEDIYDTQNKPSAFELENDEEEIYGYNGTSYKTEPKEEDESKNSSSSDEEDQNHDGNFEIKFRPTPKNNVLLNLEPDDDDNIYLNQPEEENQEDFKVNVVQYSTSSFQSEDEELSENESNHNTDYSRLGFSSQAASIFFGGDEEEQPEFERVRNFAVDNISQESVDV